MALSGLNFDVQSACRCARGWIRWDDSRGRRKTISDVSTYAERYDARVGIMFTLALVCACFTLASTSYLAWFYRLVEFTHAGAADMLSMVGGYAFQALGVGVACVLLRVKARLFGRTSFVAVVAIHFACAAAAIYSSTFAGLVVFGFAMNLLCGILSAYYLLCLVRLVPRERRGVTFGGGYALSVAITWLFSLSQGGAPLGSAASMAVCAALSLLAMGFALVLGNVRKGHATEEPLSSGSASAAIDRQFSDAQADDGSAAKAHAIVALACVTVLLLSLVKNVGFGFPSSDLAEGVSLESSRLVYMVGLIVAGIVADRNRRNAALCCLAALVVPFACLALSNEPIPGTVMWAVNYLFFGFFSVYRVLLLADIAQDAGCDHYVGFGLMFGRVGDALGTAIALVLADSLVVLVVVAAMLFVATVFAFYRLSQQLYVTEPGRGLTKEQAFERYAAAHELSVREREVLRLVLDEHTNAEIAAQLYVTEGTVKFHVRNILKKADCANRVELMAQFAEESSLR